jgi:hypothetical protein
VSVENLEIEGNHATGTFGLSTVESTREHATNVEKVGLLGGADSAWKKSPDVGSCPLRRGFSSSATVN